MDGSVLALFLISAFFGGLTTGLAGFAAGLVYSGVWLHILTPTQTAVLIASYGIVNQSYSVWKLRNAFFWRRVLPFIAGSLVGVPIGVALLTSVSPAAVRIGVGVLLIAYASYNLLKPKIKPFDLRSRHRHWRRRPQRNARGINGSGRRRYHDLDADARLAEGRSAHRLSAGHHGNHEHHSRHLRD